MQNVEPQETKQLAALLQVELGLSDLELVPLKGGKNSRVFRLVHQSLPSHIAKFYHRSATDSRDRLGTEFNALKFLWSQNIRRIPQPVRSIRNLLCGIYEYIEGHTWSNDNLTASDIDQACKFVVALNSISGTARDVDLPLASEACLSASDLIDNLTNRIANLKAVQLNANQIEIEAHAFIFNTLAPWLDTRMSLLNQNGYTLSREEQILSPSDFGFHNAILRSNGSWTFIDFEYFGWDDPVKLASDFIIHPAMQISEDLAKHFVRGIADIVTDSRCFVSRFEMLLPLYAFKWCCIMLNEFRPEARARRVFSGACDENSQEDVLKMQLEKSRVCFERFCANS